MKKRSVGFIIVGFVSLCIVIFFVFNQLIPSKKSYVGKKEDIAVTILKGYSLEDLRYGCIPEPLEINGKKLLDWSITDTVSSLYSQYDGITGNYTRISVYFHYLYGSTPLPIMILQAFEQPPNRHHVAFDVNGSLYSIDELKEFLVYEDEKILVFNFFSLIHKEKSPKEMIETAIQEINRDIEANINSPDWPPDKSIPEKLNSSDYQFLNEIIDDYYTHIAQWIFPLSDNQIIDDQASSSSLSAIQTIPIDNP